MEERTRYLETTPADAVLLIWGSFHTIWALRYAIDSLDTIGSALIALLIGGGLGAAYFKASLRDISSISYIVLSIIEVNLLLWLFGLEGFAVDMVAVVHTDPEVRSGIVVISSGVIIVLLSRALHRIRDKEHGHTSNHTNDTT